MSEGQELSPKQRLVEFKGEQRRIQQVDLNNLESVFKNIEAHNEKFSMGKMFAKGLISRILEREEDNDPISLSAEREKADALGETLGVLYANTFSPIGISIDSADTGIAFITGDEQVSESRVKFGLQNPDLFLSFLDALSTIDRKELGESTTSSLISKIGHDIFSQIYQHYNEDRKDDGIRLIEPRLGEIVQRYKNLGIIDRTGDLENYAKYAERGVLKEYIAASSAGLFVSPNEERNAYATLANWSHDVGLDLVQKRWEKAISVLEQIKSNPKATKLLQELKQNLNNCINTALQDINSKDENWDKDNEWVKRKEKGEVFENARINLQLI